MTLGRSLVPVLVFAACCGLAAQGGLVSDEHGMSMQLGIEIAARLEALEK